MYTPEVARKFAPTDGHYNMGDFYHSQNSSTSGLYLYNSAQTNNACLREFSHYLSSLSIPHTTLGII